MTHKNLALEKKNKSIIVSQKSTNCCLMHLCSWKLKFFLLTLLPGSPILRSRPHYRLTLHSRSYYTTKFTALDVSCEEKLWESLSSWVGVSTSATIKFSCIHCQERQCLARSFDKLQSSWSQNGQTCSKLAHGRIVLKRRNSSALRRKENAPTRACSDPKIGKDSGAGQYSLRLFYCVFVARPAPSP